MTMSLALATREATRVPAVQLKIGKFLRATGLYGFHS